MTNSKGFNLEDLMKIINNDPAKLAEILAAMNKTAKAERDDNKIKNAIVKLGFKPEDVVLFNPAKPLSSQPDVTVLTYRKWMEEMGRKVKAGEKSLNIRGYHVRLFHKSQTEIATTQERKAYHKRMVEQEAKRQAKNGEQASA